MGKPTVVLGAGGPTGQECVAALLKEKQGPVRAVVRNPSKYTGVEKLAGAELVGGDVSDRASLDAAMSGAKNCIFAASASSYFAPGAVDRDGVGKAADAAKAAGLERFVLVSSMLVTPRNRWDKLRLLLNNIRWGLMDAKFAGENLLRKSGVPYTIVRPGGLKNQEGNHEVVGAQGDDRAKFPQPYTSIARADVARVCVAALRDPAAEGKTFEVANKNAAASAKDAPVLTAAKAGWPDIKNLFSALKRDDELA
ncbi:unnamed protein product [Pedinophyceae sp. YPF-701]|nr:unnamed protein product [Pedinophyceae sp. YPF-701]